MHPIRLGLEHRVVADLLPQVACLIKKYLQRLGENNPASSQSRGRVNFASNDFSMLLA